MPTGSAINCPGRSRGIRILPLRSGKTAIADSRPIVLDASIAIKWYLPEILSEKALLLKDRINQAPLSVGIPQIFFLETANVLWKKCALTRELSPQDAKGVYSRILDTPFHVVEDDDILLKALDISLGHALSVYDGMYLAAAHHLNSMFITADSALIKRLTGSLWEKRISFLGDLE